jgi:hypothetical protein
MSGLHRLLGGSVPTDDEGRPLLDFAFYVTLFFENGHLPERRRAAYELLEDYWRRAGDRVRWTTNVRTFEWEPVSAQNAPAAWLAQQPEEPWKWNVCYHGGDAFDVASAVRFDALGIPYPERQLSYVDAMLPATWFAEHPEDDPVALVLRWAAALRPLHGTAGLAIATPLDSKRQGAVARRVRAVAERLPGLEVDYALSHSLYLQRGIKSANWLTCLDDALLDRLGGADALRAALPAGLRLLGYPGGAVLQAGSQPLAADEERGGSLEPYRQAARLLRPVQADYRGVFLGFDADETQEWLRRLG